MAYPKRVVTEYQRQVILDNTQDDAVKILGLSKSTVQKICRDEGIKCARHAGRGGMLRGELCNDVRRMWSVGHSVANICAEYNLLASAVCGILRIKTLDGISLYLPQHVLARLTAMSEYHSANVNYMAAYCLEEYFASALDPLSASDGGLI